MCIFGPGGCMGVTHKHNDSALEGAGSWLKITANKEPNDCGINMMRLGNHSVCMYGTYTAALATGGPATSSMICACAGLSVPSMSHPRMNAAARCHLHTLHLFLLSWRFSATLYLHTSLLEQRIALSLLILCWNESTE